MIADEELVSDAPNQPMTSCSVAGYGVGDDLFIVFVHVLQSAQPGIGQTRSCTITNMTQSTSRHVAQRQWEHANRVMEVDAQQDDALFAFDERAQREQVDAKPWKKEYLVSCETVPAISFDMMMIMMTATVEVPTFSSMFECLRWLS